MLKRLLTVVTTIALAMGTTSAQDNPVYGGTLIASVDLQTKSLDPIFGDADTADRYVYNQIYETLLRVASDGSLEPVLAESWAYSEDGLSITFTLRPEVLFHDGTPFNADAVVFNLERVLDPETRSNRRQDVLSIASVEAIDELTVRVALLEPSAAALASLGSEGGYIVSPTAVEMHGEDFARNPVGTGPFRFVDWPGGERLNLVRFEDYWGRDENDNQLPYLDEVVLRVIRQAAVATLELEAGTLHLANAIPVRDAERLTMSGNLKTLPALLFTTTMVALNINQPPFDNQLVRQALAHAFDRDQLATAIGLQQGVVTPLFVAPNEAMFNGDIPGYGYDPEKAKRLLGEAGHENLEVTLSIIQRDPDVQVAQIMQAQARAAGFDLQIEVLDRSAWLDKTLQERSHQAAMLRASTPKVDVDKTFTFYFGRESNSNYSGQQDEKVFEQVDAARAELDPERRRELYSDLSTYLLDQSYFVFLFSFPWLNVVSSDVHHIGQDISGAWVLDKTWIGQ